MTRELKSREDGTPGRSDRGADAAALIAHYRASHGFGFDEKRWNVSRAMVGQAGRVLASVGKRAGEKRYEQFGTSLSRVAKGGKEEEGSKKALDVSDENRQSNLGAVAKKKKKKKKKQGEGLEEEEDAADVLRAKLEKEVRALEVLAGAVQEKETIAEVASAAHELDAIAKIVAEKDSAVAGRLRNLSKGLGRLDRNFEYLRSSLKNGEVVAGGWSGSEGVGLESEVQELAALEKMAAESEGVALELNEIMRAHPEMEAKLVALAKRFQGPESASNLLAIQTALEESRELEGESGLGARWEVFRNRAQAERDVKNWIRELEVAQTAAQVYVARPETVKAKMERRIEMAERYIDEHPYGDALTNLLRSYVRKGKRFLSKVEIRPVSDAKVRFEEIRRGLQDLGDPDSQAYRRERRKMERIRRDYDLKNPESRLSKTVAQILEDRKKREENP